MYTFQAGKGINASKLNDNFTELQTKSNSNESAINSLSNDALRKDGSNITQALVDDFNTVTPIILSNQAGTISLQDNKQYFLTLSGSGTINLPVVLSDSYSHTIVLIVQGSSYSLDLGTQKTLGTLIGIDSTKAYQVLYIYNKIDNSWYCCYGQ
jgi:hypothetical protein